MAPRAARRVDRERAVANAAGPRASCDIAADGFGPHHGDFGRGIARGPGVAAARRPPLIQQCAKRSRAFQLRASVSKGSRVPSQMTEIAALVPGGNSGKSVAVMNAWS